MLPRHHPDRIRIAFDDHRLVAMPGCSCRATLAQHLGLPQLVDRHLDLGRAPGRANTGDKMMTLLASALAGGDCIDDADVLRTGGTACTLGSRVKAPSTLGTFLRSFRWGHVRQLDRVSRRVAGPGLEDRRRTRRCAPDHRPRFDHLRDLRLGQRGCPPPQPAPYLIRGLHRQAGLSPAAGRRRRNRRRADGPAARGPSQHRPGRRPLPARDGGAGAPCWGQGTTHHAGRQRLLYPHRGRRLPPDEGPLLHHHPPAPEPAESHRGHTRGGLDADSLLDGRRRRCGRDHLHPLPE